MAKTQAQILRMARDRLDDPPAESPSFSDPELIRWMNEGMIDIARRAECLSTTDTVAVTAADGEYTGPTDIVRIYRVEFIDGDDQRFVLEYRQPNQMDVVWGSHQTITQSAVPQFYTTWGFPPSLTIQLAPVPSQNGTLKVYYHRLPTELAEDGSAAGTSVDMPNGWENLIVDYMVARAFLRDRATDYYQLAQQEYLEHVAMLTDTSQRWNDQDGPWTPDPNWMGNGAWSGSYSW